MESGPAVGIRILESPDRRDRDIAYENPVGHGPGIAKSIRLGYN